MSEAKECPLCGKPAYTWVSPFDETQIWVQCNHAGCTMCQRNFRLDYWNARPIEDALRAELEAERKKTRELCAALDADRWIIESIAYGGDEYGDDAKEHLSEHPISHLLPERKSYYADYGLPEPPEVKR